MQVWAVVVAGGSGSRFGGPKQLEPLGGARVIDHAVAALAPHVTGTVVVVPPALVEVGDLPGDVVVAGGASRSASVRAGLAAVPADADWVLVHDGARPLVARAVIERVLAALAAGADGAIPVVPVTDSLRTTDGRPVDREVFVAVQTPQGFRAGVLREAHAAGDDASDDATLVDRVGGHVVHVAGDPGNLKITVPADLALAEVLLHDR
jgi:2-C-methyl-D-erythritol 4-phosphate cytidylyltransferase